MRTAATAFAAVNAHMCSVMLQWTTEVEEECCRCLGFRYVAKLPVALKFKALKLHFKRTSKRLICFNGTNRKIVM